MTVVGDATLFASTSGLEKTELHNLLEGQHEFEFEPGAGAVIAPFEECVACTCTLLPSACPAC